MRVGWVSGWETENSLTWCGGSGRGEKGRWVRETERAGTMEVRNE